MTDRSPFKQSCPFKLQLCDIDTESSEQYFLIAPNDELTPGPEGFPTASSLVIDGTLPETKDSTECVDVNLVDHNGVISSQKVVVRRDVLNILCMNDAFHELKEIPYLSSSAYFIICATKQPADLPGIVNTAFALRGES